MYPHLVLSRDIFYRQSIWQEELFNELHYINPNPSGVCHIGGKLLRTA
jgi:hypothetical protein